jgi:hypothetical protein
MPRLIRRGRPFCRFHSRQIKNCLGSFFLALPIGSTSFSLMSFLYASFCCWQQSLYARFLPSFHAYPDPGTHPAALRHAAGRCLHPLRLHRLLPDVQPRPPGDVRVHVHHADLRHARRAVCLRFRRQAGPERQDADEARIFPSRRGAVVGQPVGMGDVVCLRRFPGPHLERPPLAGNAAAERWPARCLCIACRCAGGGRRHCRNPAGHPAAGPHRQ